MVKNSLVISLAFFSIAAFCFEPPAKMISLATENSMSGDKASCLYPKKTDRAQSIPEIKQNWKKSQGELESLEQDSHELSAMYLDLREKFQSLELQTQGPIFTLSDSFNINTLLSDHRDMLALSTKLKILQLGKTNLPNSNLNLIKLLDSKNVEPLDNQGHQFSDLPEEIREIIANKGWNNVGAATLSNLKQLMKSKAYRIANLLDRKVPGFETTFILLWKYIFKSIDFLSKNDMADPSTIRSFFQDTEIINQVIVYVEHSFRHEMGRSTLVGSYQVTQRWYWPVLHNSFKALSKREEDMFNAHILLDFRFKRTFREHMTAYCPELQPWDMARLPWLCHVLGSFNAPKYLEEFKAINEAKKSNYEQKLRDTDFTEMINKNVYDLATLIVIKNEEYGEPKNIHQSELLSYACDVLNFIDKEISPGLIESLPYRHRLLDNMRKQEQKRRKTIRRGGVKFSS